MLRAEICCHHQLGYYDKTLAQFILSLAKKATSSKSLLEQLISNGVPEGDKAQAFAQQLYQKTRAMDGGGETHCVEIGRFHR